MFLRNKTPFEAALARGNLGRGRFIVAVVVRAVYWTAGDGLSPCEERLSPLPTDPPDLSRHALWFGVSVTAAGDVYGPSSTPFVRSVSLTVGNETRRLAVFGDRRWLRNLLGELEASPPERFDVVPLSFARAFGGSVEVPPGPFPGTDLPFPGGRLGYALNESGTGFYLDQASAEGGRLPNIELADQLVTRWSDRPLPGGFSPCPELPAMRIAPPQGLNPTPQSEAATTSEGPRDPPIADGFRAMHHAPGYLIFNAIPPGTCVGLEGVGRRAIRFEVPPSPVRVELRRGKNAEAARGVLRSIHMDAGREVVSCVFGHSFLYDEDQGPSWVLVES